MRHWRARWVHVLNVKRLEDVWWVEETSVIMMRIMVTWRSFSLVVFQQRPSLRLRSTVLSTTSWITRNKPPDILWWAWLPKEVLPLIGARACGACSGDDDEN
jgi:hypothetical protein